MAKAILQLKGDPARLRRYGDNGRRFVAENYSRQRLAAKLEKLLQAVVEGKRD